MYCVALEAMFCTIVSYSAGPCLMTLPREQVQITPRAAPLTNFTPVFGNWPLACDIYVHMMQFFSVHKHSDFLLFVA